MTHGDFSLSWTCFSRTRRDASCTCNRSFNRLRLFCGFLLDLARLFGFLDTCKPFAHAFAVVVFKHQLFDKCFRIVEAFLLVEERDRCEAGFEIDKLAAFFDPLVEQFAFGGDLKALEVSEGFAVGFCDQEFIDFILVLRDQGLLFFSINGRGGDDSAGFRLRRRRGDKEAA